jgi:hypothetical protein
LGVKKAKIKISVQTPQNETKVLKKLSTSIEKAFLVFQAGLFFLVQFFQKSTL